MKNQSASMPPIEPADRHRLYIQIGPADIGNWGMLIKKILEKHGHTAELIAGATPPMRRDYASWDSYLALDRKGYLTRLMIRLLAFAHALRKADVLIFPAGNTYFSAAADKLKMLFFLELKLYKLAGIKIIPIFLGCDLRHYIPAEKFAKEIGAASWHGCQFCQGRPTCNYRKKKNIAAGFEKYADRIYLHSEGRFFFKKTHQPVRLMFAPETVPWRIPELPPIKIVHAPSVRGKKGTDLIMPILNTIQKRYGDRVIIKLLHEIPNSQVLKEFENSHILINQIAFYDLGQVTMEAMASGMVVISSSLRTNEQIPEFDKSCPVTFANFETLAEKLSWFIDHPEEIRIAAEKGRKYVEKFHDYREVGRELVNAIETDCDE